LPRNADYNHMRCRYCGKEAALLKRLTGGGEFCSEAHKQSYQDEYNRLALGRLLQAQKISQAESAIRKAPPAAPAAPVAVEEPAAESPVREEHAVNGSVKESALLEISSLGGSVAEEQAAPEDLSETDAETEAEPLETAGFLLEAPAVAVLADDTPYLEPWLELTAGPAVADRQFQNDSESPTLSSAELLPLELRPNASPAEHPVSPADLTPLEFANGHSELSLPRKTPAVHELPSRGPVPMEVAARSIDFVADRSIAPGLDFETFVVIEDCRLLDLPFTGIEYPGAEADEALRFEQDDLQPEHGAAIHSAPSEAAEDDSPRASLEALSRLHQDLVHQEEVQEEQAAPAMVEPELVAAELVEARAVPVEPASVEEELPAGEPTPGRATDLLDVTIRMFPPAKPAPIAGVGLPGQTEPLLPNLKSLPLRPKMAIATGYVPPSAAAEQPKTAPQAAPTGKDARAGAPSKSTPASRPAARIVQPKQPATPVKVISSAKAPEAVHSEAPKPEASKQAAKTPPPPTSATKFTPPSTAKPAGTPKKEAAESAPIPAASKEPEAAESTAKAVVEETTKEVAKPAAKQTVNKALSETDEESVPNFGASQLTNTSFVGSLKVKLGIAIVLLILACSFWLGWGGKSKKTSNGAFSADGAGPSIIMGEGGWVESWGGDPSGIHAGRQITIYRPSLKLSDYRIEFQGSIETQSIGWVFRAADPENYYALKLLKVSSGLSTRVALFKYLVLNGRQTQVGRVPIDLPVQADTVFTVRTDVRGPQFSTYIQGREVDVWTDDQLKAGGVGFLNEREERGKVKSVSIRYLNSAAK
jgi:hypothetical protein